MNLCKSIENQTNYIKTEMNKAKYTGLGIHEESITDFILNSIQYENRENVLTRKFTRKDENSISGADWLWCIGERNSWITFAVQAKIMNINTGKVHFLHYSKENNEQFSKLHKFCKTFSFIPEYSIYARVDHDVKPFLRSLPEFKSLPISDWSFSAISPKYVKNLRTSQEKQISKVLYYSIPWKYILCKSENSKSLLGMSIVQNLDRIHQIIENEYRINNSLPRLENREYIDWDNPNPIKMVSDSIPLLVLYLLVNNRFPAKVPVSGVNIISNTNVNELIASELKKVGGTKRWKRFSSTFNNKLGLISD